jgi:uncharacterized protein (TIRG00374 family)
MASPVLPAVALLGFLLALLALFFTAAVTKETAGVVGPWPLLAALGACVATWWLQGLIVAVLAWPRLGRLRVLEASRVYMAGTFVAGVSPVRGAELPYEVYLLGRLGLSAGEGSTVVGTRLLLDVAVLTTATLCGLALNPALRGPTLHELLAAGLIVGAALALAVLLLRGKDRPESDGLRRYRPGWLAAGRAKVRVFIRDVRRSVASYRRRGHREILACAVALTVVYWALRLSCGPLALMAVGWSGDWAPVVLAQLLLASVILPLAPTPGGSGARELGLAALLSSHVPEGQLLSGIVVYTILTYYLPVSAGALLAGRQLWQEIFRRSVTPRQGTSTWQHDEASPPTDRFSGRSEA